MNVTILDPEARQYRCRLGALTELPAEIPAGPPPVVFALSHWSGHPQVSSRGSGDERFADLTHDGKTWTYRLSQATTAHPTPAGGIMQRLEIFDVAALAD